MSDLVAFLTARYDEDEAGAREACDRDSGEWFMGAHWNVYRTEDALGALNYEHLLVADGNVKPQSEHIARHDPARVLREVEAKRKILAWWQRGDPDPDGPAPSPTYENYRKSLPAYQLLLALAAVYQDHPDYRQDLA